MCGIFGLVGAIPEVDAKACLNTLGHRGPDGWGLWAGEGITLGHRRLSILDLSENGKQPMSDASGRYHITFNGEIYNFLEIRRELEALGHRSRTDSDTEVILAAFFQWGEACQSRFNGMWAFAIWDSQRKALFLSRDRFGKKPLFHAQTRLGFAFASEMKALMPLLDRVEANAALIRNPGRIFTYESTAECLIRGISRFPAGHCGWVRDGKLSGRRWWCTLDHLVDVPERYEEQVEQFRGLFLDACRLRMRSDVPIGTALSGGLDSSATISATAHLAKHHLAERSSAGWQHAFVASFPGTPLDEARYAQLVCRNIGVDPVILAIDPSAAISSLHRYYYLFEELYITSPIPFMQIYAEVKRNGVSVTLDGHGADELFAGYFTDFVVALRDAGLNPRLASNVLDAYFDSQFQDNSQFPMRRKALPFWLRWKLKDIAKRVLGYRSRPVSRDAAHPAFHRLDNLGKTLYTSTHDTILPTLLRNYDRYSMANGVEIRMPFMDHRLVSLAFSLPWTSKLRNGYSKAIVRDAMAPYMPSEIAYRKTKIGFNSPVVDWMRGPLRTFICDTVASRALRESSLVDVPAIEKAVGRVLNTDHPTFNDGQAAWMAISPFFWESAFLNGGGATE